MMRNVVIALYFVLLCIWLWLSSKDYFHLPALISEKASVIIGVVLTIICLVVILLQAVKKKNRFQIIVAIIACILSCMMFL